MKTILKPEFSRSITQAVDLKKIFSCLIFTTLILMGSFSSASAKPHQDIKKISPVILPEIKIVKGVVKKGATLSSILNKYLDLKTIYDISKQSEDVYSLRRIRRGQPYRIVLQDNDLSEFEYQIDTEENLVVQMSNNGFSIYRSQISYDVELQVVSSTIRSSLFESVRKAGEKIELARDLSDIFAWDIDFIRDIQPGDQYRVLVEKRYKDGKFRSYGKIMAAFFMNKGALYKAFLHKDSDGITGYYDENGRSLQKAFLKAPLEFSRISSGFSKKRYHPILNVYRAHTGVDYAAPIGTPIKTVGDGVISGIGYTKSTGNYINVRHYNGYKTRYFHMSKFAKGMKINKRISQGDIIGYVGQTGYATGPHLCFRLQKDGRAMDPLKHKSPSAHPVRPEEMPQFLAWAAELSEKINEGEKLAALHR